MKTLERMQKKTFSPGTVRQICVRREAIQENIRSHRNFPTVVVVEHGKLQEFHAVTANGTLSFDPTRHDLPAKVFIETNEGFDAFLDSDEPKFIKPARWTRTRNFFSKAREIFFGMPVISCFVGDHSKPKPKIHIPDRC